MSIHENMLRKHRNKKGNIGNYKGLYTWSPLVSLLLMKMTVLSICDLLSVSFAADDRFFLFLVRNNLRHVPWGSSTRWWHCQITLPRFKLIPLTPFSKYTHLLIWFQSLLSCIVSDLAFLDTVPNTHLIQLSISTNGITACERQIHFLSMLILWLLKTIKVPQVWPETCDSQSGGWFYYIYELIRQDEP